jgi:hypothetical protein
MKYDARSRDALHPALTFLVQCSDMLKKLLLLYLNTENK